MKKVVLFTLIAAMLATLLTGCLSASKTPEPVKPTGPSVATGKIIKLSVGLNNKSHMYIGAKKFADVVNEKSKGKYTVQVFSDAQLGDDMKATEQVKLGALEMVVTPPEILATTFPEFNVLALPFMFVNEQSADAVVDGPIGKKLADKLESQKLHSLGYFENGFRNITNSAREIKSPSDLKGLKIRTPENALMLSTFKALGANPTPMPFSEVFTAMQQKTIDGQENPIPTIYLSKFNEVQKYCTLTGHIYATWLLLINQGLWDGLSAEDKKLFEDAAKEGVTANRNASRQMVKDQVGELRKAGMIVTELTPEQKKAFQDAVAPVYTEFEPKIGKALIDEVKAAAAKGK